MQIGKTTFNVLNLSTFTKGQVYGGLVEMNIGGDDGFSMNWGTGGTDISAGRLSRAFGVGRLIEENRKISSANDFTSDNRAAMRALYSEGKSQKAVNALYSQLLADGSIVNYDDGLGQRAITENGQITVRDAAGNDVQSQMDLALTLAHEAYRNGIYDGETEQIMETASAVLGHAKMASLIEQSGYSLGNNTQIKKEAEMYSRGDIGGLASMGMLNYDSDSDYWKLMDDGSIKWDGQLNLYMDGETDIAQMDSEMGKVLDYRELNDKLQEAQAAGKGTVTLGGVEVPISEVRKVAQINDRISISGRSIFTGRYKSETDKALLEDGYMSYEEASDSANKIKQRLGIMTRLDLIEHYSTRFVLNKNDEFEEYFSDDSKLVEWSNENLRQKVERGEEVTMDFNGVKATLKSKLETEYHIADGDTDAYKWVLEDGREVVIGEKADGTRYLQMDDNYLGTYNFGTYSFVPIEFSHIPLDVFPYYSMKNTPCRFIRNLRN